MVKSDVLKSACWPLNTTMFQEKQYNLLAYTLYEKSNFFNMSNTNQCLDVRGMWVSLFFDYKSLLQTANYLVFWCASKSLRCEHSHLLELERVCGGMSTIRQTFKTMSNANALAIAMLTPSLPQAHPKLTSACCKMQDYLYPWPGSSTMQRL
jgi:hypothetical protein